MSGREAEGVEGLNGEREVTQAEDKRFRTQLSRAERDISRKIDPGSRALVIVAVMLVLILSSLLPWIGSASGWEVLLGRSDPALQVDLLPWLFSLNSSIAGVLVSALALTTRIWTVSWVAAMTCSLVSVEGLVAIWARQTVPQAGPSIGLVLAVISMVVLASQWLPIAFSRS
ncbi:hypothetical protein FHX42_003022 [Saccharopolyspora lacisalsi]|uniref:Uncharacterized protein n=1 Tax=Halosaccharopolyspora lacisalsi TaxID=1000566 RepID=A0A839DZI0_9PSEU|nr:hypothetical protein [Halosaccharopolyspora lacisalsi]MBA8825656.1 hypothetical protein [Halosaccharopolyspora lacisalsi]